MRFKTFMVAFMVFVFAFLAVNSQSEAFENEPDGYRGVRWGTPIAEFDNLQPYEVSDKVNEFYNWRYDGIGWADRFLDQSWKKMIKEDNIKNYVRKDDDLTFQDAELLSVIYTFRDGLFHGVTMLSKGRYNFAVLNEAAIEQYGKSRLMKVPPVLAAGGRHQTDAFWEGDVSCIILRKNHIFLTNITFGYMQIMSTSFFFETEYKRYEI